MKSLRQLIEDGFAASGRQDDFRCLGESLHPESFGNEVVLFAGAGLSVKGVRDRGDYFLSIGPENDPEVWFPVSRLLEFLAVGHDSDDLVPAERSIGELLKNLFSHLEAVLLFFESAEFEPRAEAFRAFQRQKANTWMERIRKQSPRSAS